MMKEIEEYFSHPIEEINIEGVIGLESSED